MRRLFPLLFVSLSLLSLLSARGWSCACGCGVFDVGTRSMLPTQPGGMAYLEYDYMDQKQDWGGSSKSSADANSDKQIRTNFFTAGVQYMLDRSWGFMLEVPYDNRELKTIDDNTGLLDDWKHSAVGDIRIKGIYSGFSPDMSTGLTFGFKLPSGDYTYPNFDSDSEIGTGSTDFLFGGYHMGAIPVPAPVDWFANAQLDLPMINSGGYRPGTQIDAALGAYYEGWKVGGAKLAPVGSLIESYRWRDTGVLADFDDSGYDRLLVAPGLELDVPGGLRVYGDVGFPVYQYVNGNQLVAAQLYKLNIGYAF